MVKVSVLVKGEDFAKIPKTELDAALGPHIELNPEDFEVAIWTDLMGYGSMPYITYKGNVPLWRTQVPLNSILIVLLKGEIFKEEDLDGTEVEVQEPSVLVCFDENQDYFVYSHWETLEEAQSWLENPVPLF